MSSDVSTPDSSWAKTRALASALGPACLLVLAALYSQWSLCRAEAMSATPEQWQAAAEFVRSQRSDPGASAIVVAPGWLDPIGRQYLGDQMSIEMLARMDSARYAAIWELSMDGERASETRGLRADQEQHFGPLRVRRYPQEPAELGFDFTEEWRAAKVSGAVVGRPSLSLEEVGFQPHRCIKVIPRPGQLATLRFESVPLGQRIVGYVGLADVFTRRDVRAPGELELLVNGTSLARVRAGVDDGWTRFEAATEAGPADVEFRLTAVGPEARDRRICFAAEARL